MARTFIVDGSLHSRFRQTQRRRAHVQVQIQCHKISQFAFRQIIIEAIKVGFRQMIKLRLYPMEQRKLAPQKRTWGLKVVLDNVVDTLTLLEVIATEQTNMHIDSLFEGGDFWEEPADVKESLDITFAKDRCKALAER